MYHRSSEQPTYTVVQINESDAARSSTLTASDIGSWCVLAMPSATYHGFYRTRGEANTLASRMRK